MANNFASNFTNQIIRVFLEKFQTARVLTKNVNTQKLDGKFKPSTGDTVFFKRPTDYLTFRNATGNLTSHTATDIITGKASGVVQDYFTVLVDYDEADEAIKMDQLDQLLAPMATRIVTDLEIDFAAFMLKNSGLLAGTFGTAVTTWSDVAEASAVLKSTGIPQDAEWLYTMNPFTQNTLADQVRSLGAGGVAGQLVKDANDRAVISSNFAGMRVMTSTALSTFTTVATGDRVGAINGTPDVTYVTAKDTMTQSIPVNLFGTFSGTIPAGEVIQITGRNRLNLSTRQPIVNGAGANVLFTGVLTADAVLSSGAGTFIVSGPAIFESGSGVGAHNTVDSVLTSGDVVTLLGNDSTLYQPNLFWHKEAFSLGSVPIKKLHSTDTLATTEDGLQFRVSLGSNFTQNSQQVRVDFRPAYSVLNPFFAGQGWG